MYDSCPEHFKQFLDKSKLINDNVEGTRLTQIPAQETALKQIGQ